MNIFLVLAHPEPKSFNGALHRAAQETLLNTGHTVRTSDLYSMQFQPVSDRRNFLTTKEPDYFKQQAEELYATDHHGFAPDVAAEMEKIEWCELMIWQFPLWWFGLPAILKGWVDRVFAMGRVYGGGKIYDTGVFRGKRAMLSLTTGGPATAYEPGGFNGDINGILRPIQRGILQFVGFDILKPHVTYGPARAQDEERRRSLDALRRRLMEIEDEEPIQVGVYS